MVGTIVYTLAQGECTKLHWTSLCPSPAHTCNGGKKTSFNWNTFDQNKDMHPACLLYTEVRDHLQEKPLCDSRNCELCCVFMELHFYLEEELTNCGY